MDYNTKSAVGIGRQDNNSNTREAFFSCGYPLKIPLLVQVLSINQSINHSNITLLPQSYTI